MNRKNKDINWVEIMEKFSSHKDTIANSLYSLESPGDVNKLLTICFDTRGGIRRLKRAVVEYDG